VYNASLEFARLWEFGIGLETGNPTFGGTRCEGRNNLVAPHTARRRLSFPQNIDATGLGGLWATVVQPKAYSLLDRPAAVPDRAADARGHHRAGDPGAAVSLAVASWRYGLGAPLSTLIVPAVLLTSPDHDDGVHAADTPGLHG
jgi:hypothetical protein